jgi:replication factor C subunit 2/4
MTGAAQTALRRIMEKEAHSTRFCLVCNYLSRIIKPIASRCTKFRFKPLSDEKSISRLEYICNEESLKADRSVLERIVNASGGDLRQAVMCLQSITRLKGKNHEITVDDALDVIGVYFVLELFRIFFELFESRIFFLIRWFQVEIYFTLASS